MSSQSFISALFKSSFLHVLLGVALVLSVDFNSPQKPQQEISQPVIEAVVIDQSKLQKQVDRLRKQKQAQKAAEEKRVRDLERRAEQAKKKRASEENRIKDLNKRRKQSEADKKRADKAAADAKKKLASESKKAKQAEADRKKREAERKKAEKQAEEARRKRIKEEQALKQAELERQIAIEKAEQEARMQQQLEQENKARQAARRKQVMTELQKYTALIKQTIQRNLIVDANMKGKSCRLNIKLASSGFVTSVKVLQGDAILCRAAHNAVLKAETLPVSQEADVFAQLKDINLTVEPDL